MATPGQGLIERRLTAILTAGMKRREFVVLLGAMAWSLTTRAQQAERIGRIGVLMGSAENDSDSKSSVAAFEEEIRKLGWIEGSNVQIEPRWAGGDIERLRTFAKDLVELQPAVILSSSQASLAALKDTTQTIPVVFVGVGDPVRAGLVSSLAQPGANITGLTNYEASMTGKWVELLKEIMPSLARVALIFNPQTHAGGSPYFLRALESAASSLGVQPIETPVHGPATIEAVIATLASEPNGGLITMPDTFNAVHRDVIISQAARYRVPAIYPFRYFAADGGLLSYGD
jgi:ABC-type uncharacterized transport system substrate-binding protein